MQEDNTYLLEESTGWMVDWSHPRHEICFDERNVEHRYQLENPIRTTASSTRDRGIDYRYRIHSIGTHNCKVTVADKGASGQQRYQKH